MYEMVDGSRHNFVFDDASSFTYDVEIWENDTDAELFCLQWITTRMCDDDKQVDGYWQCQGSVLESYECECTEERELNLF